MVQLGGLEPPTSGSTNLTTAPPASTRFTGQSANTAFSQGGKVQNTPLPPPSTRALVAFWVAQNRHGEGHGDTDGPSGAFRRHDGCLLAIGRRRLDEKRFPCRRLGPQRLGRRSAQSNFDQPTVWNAIAATLAAGAAVCQGILYICFFTLLGAESFNSPASAGRRSAAQPYRQAA